MSTVEVVGERRGDPLAVDPGRIGDIEVTARVVGRELRLGAL